MTYFASESSKKWPLPRSFFKKWKIHLKSTKKCKAVTIVAAFSAKKGLLGPFLAEPNSTPSGPFLRGFNRSSIFQHRLLLFLKRSLPSPLKNSPERSERPSLSQAWVLDFDHFWLKMTALSPILKRCPKPRSALEKTFKVSPETARPGRLGGVSHLTWPKIGLSKNLEWVFVQIQSRDRTTVFVVNNTQPAKGRGQDWPSLADQIPQRGPDPSKTP